MSYYRNPPYRGAGGGMSIGLPPMSPVNRAIMIACAAVWGVQFLLAIALRVDLSPLFGLVPHDVVFGRMWPVPHIWQLFTYLFLHSPRDPFHILFNMLMLWMLGGELERYWGSRRYLVYYLVCGVGAGVFVTILGLARSAPGSPFDPASIPTIGASGAIYGLLLAYGLIFADRIMLFMMIFPMRARTLTWILFGLAFLSNFSQARDGVSHVAHLGGMVVGYLYLKRAWHVGEFARELRWKLKRRKLKVVPPDDRDRWIH